MGRNIDLKKNMQFLKVLSAKKYQPNLLEYLTFVSQTDDSMAKSTWMGAS